ncbi:MAG: FMN-binding protein [Helicobacteraceae bacterium]|nr:FMN-binding protein [Helicobacteraceae bacterium]
MKTIALLFIMVLGLYSKVLITPQNALKEVYGNGIKIEKKTFLLNSKKYELVKQLSKSKLNSKIYRVYNVYKADKLLAYGVLLSMKVRSKKAVILYMIDSDKSINTIEVVSFNEPPEYLPSKSHLSQYKSKTTLNKLRVKRDINTISGATMSARSVARGARIALAVLEVTSEV